MMTVNGERVRSLGGLNLDFRLDVSLIAQYAWYVYGNEGSNTPWCVKPRADTHSKQFIEPTGETRRIKPL